MCHYRYTPLRTPEEIRLLTILPGEFGHPIFITIKHRQLTIPPAESRIGYPSVKEVARTLPSGWCAYLTLEGRAIFKGPSSTSWTHPDPSYDGHDFSEFGGPKLSDVGYEALSYTWGIEGHAANLSVVSLAEDNEEANDELASKFGAGLGSSVAGGTMDLQCTAETIGVRQNLAEALQYLRYSDRPRTMWIDAICINQNDVAERNKQVPRIGDIYKLADRVVAWLGPAFPDCGTACATLEYLGRQVVFTRNNRCLQSPGCVEKDWHELSRPFPFDDGTWESIYTLLCRPWLRRCWILQEIHSASAKSVIKCGVYEVPWQLFRRAVLTIENMDAGVPGRIRDLPGDVYRMNDHIAMPFELILLKHSRRHCSDPRDKIYAFISLAPKAVRQSLCVQYSLPVMEVYKEAFLACWRATRRVDSLGACGMFGAKRPSPNPTWVPDWTSNRPYDAALDSGFCSSGISASQADYQAPGQLVVDGLAVTSIMKTENPNFEDYEDVINYLRSLNIPRLQETAYCAGGTMLDAYLQLFSGDISTQGGVEFEAGKQRITEFWQDTVLSWLKSSSLFTTDRGYIGFSSAGGIQEGDKIFIILGCGVPIILRPLAECTYQVVGSCFVYGLMDGEAILGPLGDQYHITIVTESIDNDISLPRYVDNVTGVRHVEDPRLENVPLPLEWQQMQWERSSNDPLHCKKLQNKRTGEIINYDPRLLPTALVERGIDMKKITLL